MLPGTIPFNLAARPLAFIVHQVHRSIVRLPLWVAPYNADRSSMDISSYSMQYRGGRDLLAWPEQRPLGHAPCFFLGMLFPGLDALDGA